MLGCLSASETFLLCSENDPPTSQHDFANKFNSRGHRLFKIMLQMMFLQLVLAPRPKTDLPAQHISQTLLLYYNPSKHLRKIKVENVLEGMRQGKGQVFCINRSLDLTMTLRTNINQISFLPLWKTHSSRKKKNMGKIFQKKEKRTEKEFSPRVWKRTLLCSRRQLALPHPSPALLTPSCVR